MTIIEGILDLQKYDFTDTSFDLLMQKRIHRVLVICSNYDNYMLEEDGRIDEQIFNEYASLNLRYPPTFVQTDNAEDAFTILQDGNIDLVISMLSLKGTDVFALAKRIKAKIFQASTSEVYGDPKVHPQPESYWGNVNPIGFRSCYDEGKRCAETLFFDYRRQHKLRIKVARIFNTYGPKMHPNDGRVVSNFILQALRGDNITIYGNGKQTRSFCYADDLIDGLIRLMATPDDFTGPVNLGNPSEFTIMELAQKIIQLTKSRSKIVFKPLPEDDPTQRQPDITLAKRILKWHPKVPLEQGLRKTIAYFKKIA